MLDKLEADIKTALIAGETFKVEVLKGLKNAIIVSGKERGSDITDDEAIKIAQREIKKRREAAQIYTKANESKRADKENQEVEILKTYLPEQLSIKEIENIVDKVIADNGIDSSKKIGMAIGLSSKEIGVRADGATIASVVKKKLGV